MTSFCLNSMLGFLWGKLIDYVCDICPALIEFIWWVWMWFIYSCNCQEPSWNSELLNDQASQSFHIFQVLKERRFFFFLATRFIFLTPIRLGYFFKAVPLTVLVWTVIEKNPSKTLPGVLCWLDKMGDTVKACLCQINSSFFPSKESHSYFNKELCRSDPLEVVGDLQKKGRQIHSKSYHSLIFM